MSVLLETIRRYSDRSHAWGECLWTAPDLFAQHAVIHVRPYQARDIERQTREIDAAIDRLRFALAIAAARAALPRGIRYYPPVQNEAQRAGVRLLHETMASLTARAWRQR